MYEGAPTLDPSLGIALMFDSVARCSMATEMLRSESRHSLSWDRKRR